MPDKNRAPKPEATRRRYTVDSAATTNISREEYQKARIAYEKAKQKVLPNLDKKPSEGKEGS